MTIKLTAILLLITNIAFAQYRNQPTPTQFDKFISQPNIEWAAYNNDTIRFEKIVFNNLLLRRLAKDEIRAAMPITFGIDNMHPVLLKKKKDIDRNVLYPVNEIPIFDSNGNKMETKSAPFKIDTGKSYLTSVTQILYTENGELKSYIPWVGPSMLSLVTSSGINLGMADYFSTCFNYKYNYQPGKQNKIILLQQTKRKIRFDSVNIDYKLKELYGRNLIETLWPQILKNKYSLFAADSNKKILAAALNSNLIYTTKIMVPVYDENGSQTAIVAKAEPLSLNEFTAADLVQDWQYDFTNNILCNTIRSLTLYAKKRTADGIAQEASPILKIVFN